MARHRSFYDITHASPHSSMPHPDAPCGRTPDTTSITAATASFSSSASIVSNSRSYSPYASTFRRGDSSAIRAELERLQASAMKALQQSWKEEEEISRKAAEKDEHIAALERELSESRTREGLWKSRYEMARMKLFYECRQLTALDCATTTTMAKAKAASETMRAIPAPFLPQNHLQLSSCDPAPCIPQTQSLHSFADVGSNTERDGEKIAMRGREKMEKTCQRRTLDTLLRLEDELQFLEICGSSRGGGGGSGEFMDTGSSRCHSSSFDEDASAAGTKSTSARCSKKTLKRTGFDPCPLWKLIQKSLKKETKEGEGREIKMSPETTETAFLVEERCHNGRRRQPERVLPATPQNSPSPPMA